MRLSLHFHEFLTILSLLIFFSKISTDISVKSKYRYICNYRYFHSCFLLTISPSRSTLLSYSFVAPSNHPIGAVHSELKPTIAQIRNWPKPSKCKSQPFHRPNSKSTQTHKVQKPTIPPPKFKIYPNPQSAETNFLQCSYLSLSIFLFFFSMIFLCFFSSVHK